jgi:uncharacterized membrane protein
VAEFKASYLVRGLPGHPLHPPLTDATIGIYTFATVAAILSKLGVADHALAQAWWLALIVGLVTTALNALTGFLDWVTLTWGSELWKTATLHMTAMLTATVFFLLAAIFGHSCYVAHDISTGPFILTLVGFVALTTGGWLGGAVTYVHGMRVLNLVDEPAPKAAAPYPSDEKAEAEEG